MTGDPNLLESSVLNKKRLTEKYLSLHLVPKFRLSDRQPCGGDTQGNPAELLNEPAPASAQTHKNRQGCSVNPGITES